MNMRLRSNGSVILNPTFIYVFHALKCGYSIEVYLEAAEFGYKN